MEGSTPSQPPGQGRASRPGGPPKPPQVPPRRPSPEPDKKSTASPQRGIQPSAKKAGPRPQPPRPEHTSLQSRPPAPPRVPATPVPVTSADKPRRQPIPPLQKSPSVPATEKPTPQPPSPKQAVSVNASKLQGEVNKMLEKQEIEIRTMQDDLAASRGTKPPTKTPPAHPSREASRGQSAASPSAFPLPPKKAGTKPEKVIMRPAKRQHRSRIVPLLVILLILSVLGGGGALAWLQWGDTLMSWLPFSDVPGSTTDLVAIAPEILPADSALVVQYHIASTDDRSRVLSAWQQAAAGSAATMSELLAGDPRLLLDDPAIEEFYYVVLEDEVRPYLVVPKLPSTEQLLGATPDAHVTELRGWYVAHSVSVDNYLARVQQSSLSAVGGDPVLNISTAQTPIRFIAGPSVVIAAREALLGSRAANGVVQQLSAAGRFVAQAQALELAGQAVLLATITEEAAVDQPLTPVTSDQRLLSLVPASAHFVSLGGDLAADLAIFADTSRALDQAALDQPAVASIVGMLASPYAFYSTSLNSTAHDYGLIVRLPETVAGTLEFPNPAIESGLSALLPLLTGRQGITPTEFSDNTHAGIPLRYANFSEPTQALDYAITDQYLLVATSRGSMFDLLETVTGQSPALEASPRWSTVLATWGAVPAAPQLILGQLQLPILAPFVPGGAGELAFGMSFTPAAAAPDRSAVQGVVLFPDNDQPQGTSSSDETRQQTLGGQ